MQMGYEVTWVSTQFKKHTLGAWIVVAMSVSPKGRRGGIDRLVWSLEKEESETDGRAGGSTCTCLLKFVSGRHCKVAGEAWG